VDNDLGLEFSGVSRNVVSSDSSAGIEDESVIFGGRPSHNWSRRRRCGISGVTLISRAATGSGSISVSGRPYLKDRVADKQEQQYTQHFKGWPYPLFAFRGDWLRDAPVTESADDGFQPDRLSAERAFLELVFVHGPTILREMPDTVNKYVQWGASWHS